MGAKVLLVRLSSLGDVILATSAVEALREDAPGAEVHVLTKPVFREVFRQNPGVSRVLEWLPADGLGPLSPLSRLVRSEGYGWIVDLHRNLRTALLRAAVRGPRWRAYSKGTLRRRAAVWFHRPELLESAHVVDRYVAALRPLGVRPQRRLPRVYPDEAQRGQALETLALAGWGGAAPPIALAPGARWRTKAWPREHWSELMGRIGEKGAGFPVLVGGAEDEALCREIGESCGGPRADLAGKTSILETAAVLQVCSALVTGDSAPLHLATAVGTPVVALFGPTVRGFGFYPLGPRDILLEKALPCRPCSLHGDDVCPEGHHSCLRELAPADVFRSLEELLAGG